MPVRERRRGNQSRPADKANYLVIGGLFLVVMTLLLKPWSEQSAREAFILAGTIVGGLINFLTHHTAQNEAQVNAGTVENVTVKPEPVSEYREGDTEELTLEKRRRLGIP